MRTPLSERVKMLAKKIDEYHDGLLFEGMPEDDARQVEAQRSAMHALLLERAMQESASDWGGR